MQPEHKVLRTVLKSKLGEYETYFQDIQNFMEQFKNAPPYARPQIDLKTPMAPMRTDMSVIATVIPDMATNFTQMTELVGQMTESVGRMGQAVGQMSSSVGGMSNQMQKPFMGMFSFLPFM